jgi:hypothetical protein
METERFITSAAGHAPVKIILCFTLKVGRTPNNQGIVFFKHKNKVRYFNSETNGQITHCLSGTADIPRHLTMCIDHHAFIATEHE